MVTRKTTKPKRCLKFEGYIYLPSEGADFNEMRYHAVKRTGRIKVYDEYGNKIGKKDHAFINMGDAVNYIEEIRKKIILKRIKTKK